MAELEVPGVREMDWYLKGNCIRARLPEGREDGITSCCPIEAVYLAKHRGKYAPHIRAADELGLSVQDRDTIAFAADRTAFAM